MSAMTSHVRPLCILGTGHALPAKALSSAALDARLGLPPGTLERRGGVRIRHVAGPGDTAAALGAQAARLALQAAGLTLNDLDAVVAASGTMDQGMPSNAALIHAELGLSPRAIPAFDINASCLGFLAALDQLAWPIAAGRYRHVLIVAADLASCGLDWSQLEASAIFGDGAAAAVVGQSPRRPHGLPAGRLLAARLCTYSDGASFCEIPAGGSRYHPSRLAGTRATCTPEQTAAGGDHAMPASSDWRDFLPLTRFRMDGKRVFKLASQHIDGFLDALLQEARVKASDLDWIVPHQASHLAMEHLTRRLGLDAARIINIFADHGNQVAASLPTALDIGIRSGRIQRGQRLLLIGSGAGLSIGGAVLEY